MSAEKSPIKFKSFLITLMLVLLLAGGAAYLYGLKAGSKDAETVALKEPGQTIKEESLTEQAAAQDAASADNAESAYPPESSSDGEEDLMAQAADDPACTAPEDFEAFYARFKADEEFKFRRTRFPLRKRVFSGAGSDQTEEVFAIEKDQILAKDELVYLDPALASGYSEGMYANSPSQVDIRTGPEDSDPLTVHKFHNESGCWFLYEFESYEYSGSNNILAL